MDSRQRFRETMAYGATDRPPLFLEGIRDEVISTWRSQGFSAAQDLSQLFTIDERDEVEPNLWPSPYPTKWPNSLAEARALVRRLDAADPHRLPDEWTLKVKSFSTGEQVRMLYVHNGFFELLGVDGWKRFNEVMYLIKDDPGLIRYLMMAQGEFNARIAKRLLQEIEIEAAVFSEPIGGNHGPLISPKFYREIVIPSYRPILEVLHQQNVKLIILRTYANCGALVPSTLDAGFNCFWAVEAFGDEVDYRNLRQKFGRDLRLIGGIDLDVLRLDKNAIKAEIALKVPPLLEQGGFAPLADGRVRIDIPWQNYCYYRQLLQQVVCGENLR